MKNCIDCKFSYTKSVDLMSSKEQKEFKAENYVVLSDTSSLCGQRVGRCKAGHNAVLEKFWKENGSKTRDDIEMSGLELPCHDYDDGIKMLDSISKKVDELAKLLR